MYNSFISQEKQRTIIKMLGKRVIENLSLLFVVIAHEQVARKARKARWHVSM